MRKDYLYYPFLIKMQYVSYNPLWAWEIFFMKTLTGITPHIEGKQEIKG